MHAELVGAISTQAEYARIPLADGTLVAAPDVPSDDLIPSVLAASDVLGTGWFAAVAADAGPGKTVVVVGDGAVGLLGVLAATQLGAERIIAMSRHDSRQKLAREFGATDIVSGVHLHSGPARSDASCPNSSTSSEIGRSTPARSSTSPFPSTRPPRATRPRTNAAPSRPCSSPDVGDVPGPVADSCRQPGLQGRTTPRFSPTLERSTP